MHRRPTAPTIAFCLAGLTLACGPEKGTTSPESGKTQEEIDAERKAAAEQARTLGLVDLANQDLANGRYVSAKQRADEALEEDLVATACNRSSRRIPRK